MKKVMGCFIPIKIQSMLRKNVLFATEPGMLKVESVKPVEDRGTCSLPSLQ
jgi:hypothetical protein